MLLDFLVAIGAATLVGTLFFYLKIPSIIGLLVAGVLIGPSGFSLIQSLPRVDVLAETAAILLMFSIGLEFSFSKLKRYRKAFLLLGFGQLVLTFFAFLFVFYQILEIDLKISVLLSMVASLSSTATVLKILHEKRDLESPNGQASISILLMQDMAVIPMVLLLPFLASNSNDLLNYDASVLFSASMFLLAAVLTVFLVSRYVVPYVLKKVVQTRSKELFFFFTVFLALFVAHIMHQMNLSYSFGAFLAGMLISSSPYSRQAMSEVLPLRDNFLGFFFVTMGMLLDLNFVAEHFFSVALMTVSAILIKFVVVFLLLWIVGNPVPVALLTAMTLFQVGEFSFILIERALHLEIISSEMRQYFLSTSLFSLALTPFLYRFFYGRVSEKFHWKIMPKFISSAAVGTRNKFLGKFKGAVDLYELSRESKDHLSNHVIVVGCGITGKKTVEMLKKVGIPYLIIEFNSKTVEILKGENNIIFGDATRSETLLHAGIERALMLIVTVPSTPIIQGVLNAAEVGKKEIKKLVRVQYVQEAERLKHFSNINFIIGETESTLELVYQVFQEFELQGTSAVELVDDLRLSLEKDYGVFKKTESRYDMPKWESLRNVTVVDIQKGDFAVDKSLQELNLRFLSGASVMCVYRPEKGTLLPSADFVFAESDTLYLLGEGESKKMAQKILKDNRLD